MCQNPVLQCTSGVGSGTVQGTATSLGPTTSFNGTADMSYSSTTVIRGSQNGCVALVKYIDVKK